MRQTYLTMGFVLAVSVVSSAEAQYHHHPQDPAAAVHRHHPPQDQELHEKFYSTWYMPDDPAKSCCNTTDCYPTEIKYVGSNIYARRRGDGKYILIPPQKVERNRDNPDGRNHLCAPPPSSYYPADIVFCFSLGGGI
jgi:hypothetical protein